jgi:DNA-binding NarL/FixJ family response regulator
VLRDLAIIAPVSVPDWLRGTSPDPEGDLRMGARVDVDLIKEILREDGILEKRKLRDESLDEVLTRGANWYLDGLQSSVSSAESIYTTARVRLLRKGEKFAVYGGRSYKYGSFAGLFLSSKKSALALLQAVTITHRGSTVWLFDLERGKHDRVLTLVELLESRWGSVEAESGSGFYQRFYQTEDGRRLWPLSEEQWESGEWPKEMVGGPPAARYGMEMAKEDYAVREATLYALAPEGMPLWLRTEVPDLGYPGQDYAERMKVAPPPGWAPWDDDRDPLHVPFLTATAVGVYVEIGAQCGEDESYERRYEVGRRRRWPGRRRAGAPKPKKRVVKYKKATHLIWDPEYQSYEEDLLKLIGAWSIPIYKSRRRGRRQRVKGKRRWHYRRPVPRVPEQLTPESPEYVRKLYGRSAHWSAVLNCFDVRYRGAPVWWTDLDGGPIRIATLYDLAKRPHPWTLTSKLTGSRNSAGAGRTLWLLTEEQWESGNYPPPEQGGPPSAGASRGASHAGSANDDDDYASAAEQHYERDSRFWDSRAADDGGILRGGMGTRGTEVEEEEALSVSDEDIARMYSEGMSIRDIAGAFGVSRQFVEKSLKRSGTPTRSISAAMRTPQSMGKSGVTPERVQQEIVRLYQGGMSMGDIAYKMKVEPLTVSKILARQGVEMRPAKRITPEMEREFAAMYSEGSSTYDIARRFGLAPSTVGKALRARGVEMRPTALLTPEKRITPEQEQKMIELYRAGHTTHTVATMLGVAQSTVHKVLVKHNEPRRPQYRHEEAHDDDDNDDALICMGRDIVLELGKDDFIELPERWGMLHDPSGNFWPSCSLLFAPFRQGTEEDDSDEGRGYFGNKTDVWRGHIKVPPHDLQHGWHEVGIVQQVFYERAGKHAGRYKHKFNDPRGWMWLVALFKSHAAKTPPVLFECYDCNVVLLRLELPDGCVVDDRGIALP